MTQNQLKRQENLERERNNREVAAETYRNHVEMENITRQHNAAMQYLQEKQVNELARSNIARELETNRSNVENERLRRDTLGATYDTLAETINHNRAQESTNLLLAGIQSAQQREQARSNLASENIRSGQLVETVRHQTAQDERAKYQTSYNLQSLEEQRRHNQATEGLTKSGNVLNFLSSITGTIGRYAALKGKSSSTKVSLKG